jgi:hypothetical protein
MAIAVTLDDADDFAEQFSARCRWACVVRFFDDILSVS